MVNENDPDSSKEEIAKMTDTIANLQETVGTIQTELSKVSSSVGPEISDIKKLFEQLMMGKPKGSEESLEVSDEVSLEEDTPLPDIAKMEANIAKAKAKAERRDKHKEKAKGSKSSSGNGSGIIQESRHLKTMTLFIPLSPCHTFLMLDILPCLTLTSLLVGSLIWSLTCPLHAPPCAEVLVMDFILMT